MFSKVLFRNRLPFLSQSFTKSYVKNANESFVTPLKILTTNKSSDYVLTHRLNITERASNRLNEIYKESKEVLSILVESGGCHGFQYNLKLFPDAELNDLDLKECTVSKALTSATSNTTNNNENTIPSEGLVAAEIKSKQEQAVASPETTAGASLTMESSTGSSLPEKEDEFDEDEFGEEEFGEDVDKLVIVLPTGAKLCIDSKSLQILNGTNLTYTTELIGSSFKIEGGNMKSSCGCGSSFDV